MKTKQAYLGLTVVCLSTFGTAGGLHAQNDAPNPTKASADTASRAPNQWGRFESAFAALSEKYQTALVCESAPLRPVLSSEAAAALETALETAATQEARIIAVARAYDYEPTFVDARTVVLVKRYGTPDDLPEVTLGEAVWFVDTLRDETASLRGTKIEPDTQPIMDLLQTATPEQQAAYAAGARWDTLPADFWKRFTYAHTWRWLPAPLRSVDRLAARLRGVQKPNNTVFKMASFYGMTLPAYEGASGTDTSGGSNRFQVPLSANVRTTAGGGTAFTGFNNSNVPPSAGGAKPFDPSQPGKDDLQAGSSKALLPCQQTLEQWADGLNRRLASSGGAAASVPNRVELPAMESEKTVCLFGADRYLTPLQSVKAVGQTMGLRGGMGSDNVARIFLPAPAHPLSTADTLGEEVLRLMPASLLRALSANWVEAPPFAASPLKRLDIQPGKADRLFAAAIKRLRVLVEPKIAASNNNPVPLEAASSEAKNLIAVSSLLSEASTFRVMMEEHRNLWADPIPIASTVKITRDNNGVSFRFQEIDDKGNNILSMSMSFGLPTPTPPQ